MRTLAALGLPVGLLPRRRAFARLFAARGLSSLSGGTYRFALIWLVTVRTGSALLLGATAAAMAMAALLAPAFGALADRLPKHRVLVTTDTGCAMACAALAGLGLTRGFPVVPVYGLAFAVSCLGMLDWTALHATIPRAVAAEELTEANGLWATGMNALQLLAPALAGLLVAAAGAVAGLAAAAAGYGLAAWAVSRVRVETPAPAGAAAAGRPRFWTETWAGVRYVLADPVLTRLTVLAAGLNLAFSASQPMVMWLLQRRLGLRASPAGLVFSAEAAGTFLASAAYARFGRRIERGLGIMGSGLLFGLALEVWAVAGHAAVAALAAVVGGFAVATGNLHMLTLRQEMVPAELLGRTLGTTAMLGRLVMTVAPALGAAVVAGPGLVVLFAGAGGVAFAAAGGLGPGLWAAARRRTGASPGAPAPTA